MFTYQWDYGACNVSIASSSANTPGQKRYITEVVSDNMSQSLLRQRILPDSGTLLVGPSVFGLCLNRFFVSEYSRTFQEDAPERTDRALSQSLLRQRILPDGEFQVKGVMDVAKPKSLLRQQIPPDAPPAKPLKAL